MEKSYYLKTAAEVLNKKTDLRKLMNTKVETFGNEKQFFCKCPFHNEKRSVSMYVDTESGLWHCFSCGEGGNAVAFVMKAQKTDFIGAVRWLCRFNNVKFPERQLQVLDDEHEVQNNRYLEMLKLSANFYASALFQSEGASALRYLHNRGMADEAIRRFGLGYAPGGKALVSFLKQKGFSEAEAGVIGLVKNGEDYFRKRVMFPIMADKHVLAFGARATDESVKPKYLNSPDSPVFSKRTILYGMPAKKSPFIVLCEGYMDALSLKSNGFAAAASLGTALTEQQCKLLSQKTKHVVLAYDMDDAGRKAALRAFQMLEKYGVHCVRIDLLPCKDPDEFLKKHEKNEFENRLRKSIPGDVFEIREMSKLPEWKETCEKWAVEKLLSVEKKEEWLSLFQKETGIKKNIVLKQMAASKVIPGV